MAAASSSAGEYEFVVSVQGRTFTGSWELGAGRTPRSVAYIYMHMPLLAVGFTYNRYSLLQLVSRVQAR